MAKNGALSGIDTSSSEAAKQELARKVLRDASEAARASFPRQFTDTELVLIDVDPHHLHAFWTVPLSVMEDARRLPGAADATMVMRVSPLGDADDTAVDPAFFDVEVSGLRGRTYVSVWQRERRYKATLGLRTADGGLIAIASSGEIALPPTGPAPETAPPPLHEPEASSAAADPFPHLFDLEAVLPVSSYIVAGDRVAFEATAELHIHGHAEPGSTVRLFGNTVPVRPDGSFSVVHVLAHDSPLLASILAAAAAEPESPA